MKLELWKDGIMEDWVKADGKEIVLSLNPIFQSSIIPMFHK
jgi:hypothetical protein